MAEETKTEVKGGPIPKTTDEWKSRAEWEEYNRRQETRTGLRDIAITRRQAELDKERAKVTDREQAIAEGQSELALAEGARAVASAEVSAAEQDRAARMAGLSLEAHQAELAARRRESGLLDQATEAQIAQREGQIKEIAAEAAFAIEDAELAAAREAAEASVMSAARGAAGSAVEQVQKAIRDDAERQKGRIGTKAQIATARAEAGKAEVEARGEIAQARHEAAIERTEAEVGLAEERQASHVLQAQLIRGEYTTAEGVRITSAMEIAAQQSLLSAGSFEAAAAGLGLDARAQRDSAHFGQLAADHGLDALVNRPPIPDWNAIGRKQERANRWSRASGIVSTVTSILSWF